MNSNWFVIKSKFTDDFLSFYNCSHPHKKRFLKEMIQYNLKDDTQGNMTIDDEALCKLERQLIQLDGTLLCDLVCEFLRTYQIYE